jgi:RimJ/RimL family protein N-acetyltransferase
MLFFFETERLTLRRFTEDDAGLLFELDSDPEVMRWLNGGKPTPMELIRGEILPRFMEADERGLGYWAAIERATSDFMGWFAMHPVEGRREGDAEVGYRLRRAAWGKGLATEGVRALLAKGFEELGLQRIYATTYEENVRSRRVMEKAGMRLARTFHWTPEEPGPPATFVVTREVWDGEDVEYAITREEWVGTAGSGFHEVA